MRNFKICPSAAFTANNNPDFVNVGEKMRFPFWWEIHFSFWGTPKIQIYGRENGISFLVRDPLLIHTQVLSQVPDQLQYFYLEISESIFNIFHIASLDCISWLQVSWSVRLSINASACICLLFKVCLWLSTCQSASMSACFDALPHACPTPI